MNNEEAIKIIGKLKPNDKFDSIKKMDALMVALETLENQQKYRWHDLRKNPNDVPTENGRKYIITQCGTNKYHIAKWDENCFGEWGVSSIDDDSICFNEFAQVDRWKEVEPFEEDINVTNKEDDDV